MWSAGWGVWPAAYELQLFPSSHPARTRKPGSSCLRRRSIAVAFAGDEFRATHFHRLAAIDLSEPCEKIRPRGRDDRLNRHEPRNNAFALGDLDFLTLAEKVFDFAKAVAQIAYRGFSHVIHNSIT